MPGDNHDPSEVVVVGAGVIGLAIAWRLAARGMTVTLTDPSPASGATGVAAGMLAPVNEARHGEEPLLRLNLHAAEQYAGFAAEVADAAGEPVGYRETATLAVALDAGDAAALDDLHRFQNELGLDARTVSRRECRELEPLLAPSVHGGVLTGDRQVDPRRLAGGLMTAAERAGVRFRRDRVAALSVREDTADGVHLDDGTELPASHVVLAAGTLTAEIDGVPDEIRRLVRPVKGQIVRLHVPTAYRPFLNHVVRGTVRGRPVYLVPREDGELVIGATQEELGDEVVTAGGVYELLRDAHDLVPGITELPLAETAAGLRPSTPDNAPIIGPTGLPGLVVATGHFRNGVLLAPVTADAIAGLLGDGALPDIVADFTPQRFTAAPLEGAHR